MPHSGSSPSRGHLDFGDQPARCRIPPGIDAGSFADHTASSVAPDDISRAQRLAARVQPHLVAAKLSSWPLPQDATKLFSTIAAFDEIATTFS